MTRFDFDDRFIRDNDRAVRENVRANRRDYEHAGLGIDRARGPHESWAGGSCRGRAAVLGRRRAARATRRLRRPKLLPASREPDRRYDTTQPHLGSPEPARALLAVLTTTGFLPNGPGSITVSSHP